MTNEFGPVGGQAGIIGRNMADGPDSPEQGNSTPKIFKMGNVGGFSSSHMDAMNRAFGGSQNETRDAAQTRSEGGDGEVPTSPNAEDYEDDRFQRRRVLSLRELIDRKRRLFMAADGNGLRLTDLGELDINSLSVAQKAEAEGIENTIEIVTSINYSAPDILLSAYDDMKAIVIQASTNEDSANQLDRIFPLNARDQLERRKLEIDARYQDLLSKLTSDEHKDLFSDIQAAGISGQSSLESGFRSEAQVTGDIFKIALNPRKTEKFGYEGIKRWFAFKEAERVIDTHRVEQRFKVSTDPIENIFNAEYVMRIYEKDRNPDKFNDVFRTLTQMERQVVATNDLRVSKSMKERMTEQIDAFASMNRLLYAQEITDGDIGAEFDAVKKNFKNYTEYRFYERFRHETILDPEGKKYLVDANGRDVLIDKYGNSYFRAIERVDNQDTVVTYNVRNEVVPSTQLEELDLNPLNILSETVGVDFYSYEVDRFRFNRVEDATKQDIVDFWRRMRSDPEMEITARDTEWIIRRLLSKPQNFNLVNLTPGELSEASRKWIGESEKDKVVQAWQREATLMGADGFEVIRDERGLDVEMKRDDIWLEIVAQRALRDRLLNRGVDSGRVDDLLGKLRDSEKGFDPRRRVGGVDNPDYNPIVVPSKSPDLISAVKRNSYDLVRFQYADSLDTLRVYKTGETRPWRYKTVFRGENTPDNAWAISHLMDFAQVEGQGDPDGPSGDPLVNAKVMEITERLFQGHFMAQNSTAFRIFNTPELLPQRESRVSKDGSPPPPMMVGDYISGLVSGEGERISADRAGWQTRDYAGYVNMELLSQGINPALVSRARPAGLVTAEQEDNGRGERERATGETQKIIINPELVKRQEVATYILNELAHLNMETSSKTMKQFPLKDMLEDRLKTMEWFSKYFIPFLKHGTDKELDEAINNFYSGRLPRIHPGTEFLLELQWEIGQMWDNPDIYGYQHKMAAAEWRSLVKHYTEENKITRERAEALERRVLGERSEILAKEISGFVGSSLDTTLRSPGWWAGRSYDAIKSLIETFLKYMMSGLK